MVRFALAGGRVPPAKVARRPLHRSGGTSRVSHLESRPSDSSTLDPRLIAGLIALAIVLAVAVQASAAPTVWVAPSYLRVKQDASPGAASEISVYSARGEWESFQIAVAGSATNVRIAPPASAPVTIKLYREHYVPVTHGSGTYSSQTNKPEGPGLYPDALIPFDAPGGTIAKAQPYSIPSGKVQPYWVDLFVPRDCPAGEHSLAFTVTSDQGSATVTARLTVWAFELPQKPALQTAFAYWPPVRGQLQPELVLLENRIQPTFVEATHSATLAAAGQSAAHVGFWASLDKSNCTIAKSKPTAAEVDAAIAKYAPLEPYAYLADEVYTSCDSSTPLFNWTEELRGKVKTMVTIAPRTGWEWLGIFVTLPKFDVAADVVAAQARGSEVWSYNCLAQDGYSPKWLLDYAPINYRIQPGFLNWRRGLTGLLYWRVDYWSGGTANPWTSGEVYSSASYPGEGMLVYPGANIGMASNTVAPSMRLKYLRDGADDYDYLALLAAGGDRSWAQGIVASIATDWRTWSRDPVALEAARRQLGERLSAAAAPHTLSVTASASPSAVASSGATSLSAGASDSLGHSIAAWSWSDGGAGGVFSPSASVQNPAYVAPANTTGADLTVSLAVSATCDGSSPVSGEAAAALIVHSASHELSVSASSSPTTVASGGSASLSADVSDSLGHAIASWTWSDGGAGGAFTPSASVQDPAYTASANTSDDPRGVTLTVTATCAGPTPATDSATTAITVEPVAHTLSVTANASPTTVASGGSTTLLASAADSRGHEIIGWQWSDGGAGGSFAPSAGVPAPAYTAPQNTSGARTTVTLTVTAVCSGPTPLSGSAAVSIAVEPAALSLTVEAAAPVPAVVPSESTASLSASTDDPATDESASWRWDDAGAHGSFLPSASERTPQYRAPRNASGHEMRVVLTVTASCSEPVFMQGADDTAVIVQPAPHALTVSASAQPSAVTWKGRTQLYAAADDSLGHGIARWAWSDNGAGGSFSPSASVQAPTYRVPPNASVATTTIILSVSGTCDGPSPLSATGYFGLVVQPKPGVKLPGTATATGDSTDSVLILPSDTDAGPVFADVPDGFWAGGAIEACLKAGVLTGYPDGSYHPELAITRDQVAVYIARAICGGDDLVPPGPAVASFADVPTSHWAYRYVEHAKELGIVNGFPDGRYRPAAQVNRAEMATFIARSIVLPLGDEGLEFYQPPAQPTFSDVPGDHWAYRYVEFVADQGVAQGYDDGTYRPTTACTRAETAVYLARAFNLPL